MPVKQSIYIYIYIYIYFDISHMHMQNARSYYVTLYAKRDNSTQKLILVNHTQ